ncbi:MAG TPA: 23S rRNA (adenine(2503)-C(2))-methyltransferase RlmN, partial [Acidimicrobiales bacterium]|nr:23S rRNA (adenine(2503)-C(2))-methyltransferase RlmN [Acidimicrobiales bacterium]
MEGPYDLSERDLAGLLAGEPPYRVRQVWAGLHAGLRRPAEMTDLPAPLRQRLEAALPPALTPVARRESDGGSTVK